jgi:hypothetical protein
VCKGGEDASELVAVLDCTQLVVCKAPQRGVLLNCYTFQQGEREEHLHARDVEAFQEEAVIGMQHPATEIRGGQHNSLARLDNNNMVDSPGEMGHH